MKGENRIMKGATKMQGTRMQALKKNMRKRIVVHEIRQLRNKDEKQIRNKVRVFLNIIRINMDTQNDIMETRRMKRGESRKKSIIQDEPKNGNI